MAGGQPAPRGTGDGPSPQPASGEGCPASFRSSRGDDRPDAPRTGQGVSWRKSIEEIDAWAAAATAGAVLVYGHASFMAGTAAGAAAMRLHDAGTVTLLPQRRAGDGLFDYAMRRLAPRRGDRPAPPAPRPEPTMREELAAASEPDERERLLTVLERVAAERRSCPTNRELARLAGLRDASGASYALGKLERAGRIRVERNDYGTRVVTILASGRSTRRGR